MTTLIDSTKTSQPRPLGMSVHCGSADDHARCKIEGCDCACHLVVERRHFVRAHAAKSGAWCRDAGDGTCSGCGVALVECPACHGIGYHRGAEGGAS